MADQELVGREHELSVLREAFEHALGGVPRACFVTGAVGVGKSAVLEAAVAQAEALGFAVASGRAGELSRYVPFGVLVEALASRPGADDADIGALRRLTSSASATGDTNDIASEWRFQMFAALLEAVELRSATQPLLLAVDDLSQADTGSVAALELILAHVVARPLVVVATFRTPLLDRSVEALLEGQDGRPGTTRLDLEPLPDDAVLQLAERLLRARVGPSLRSRLAGAGGNPLLVCEYIRAAQQEGLIELADGGAHLLQEDQPLGAVPVIARRLGFLPENVLQTVRVAAVAGHPVLPDTLALIQDRPVSDVVGECEIAIRADVLAEAGDGRLVFRHDLLREVVYEHLAPSVRTALHRHYTRVLRATNGEAAAVAHHLRRGARRGDHDAVAWLRRAAAEESRRDPSLAADLLGHAVQLARFPADAEAELRTELAALLVWSNVEQAEVEARTALDLAGDPSIRAGARAALIRSLSQRASWQQLAPEVAAFAADPAAPSRDRLRALADTVVFRGWSGDPDGAQMQGQQAFAQALAEGDAVATVCAQAGLAGVLVARGRLGEALEGGRAAVRRSQLSGDDDARRRHAQIPLALILQECDRFDEEAEVIVDGRSTGTHLGTWHLPLYHFLEGARLYLSGGGWDDATAEIEAGFSLAQQTGITSANPWGHALLALMASQRGDIAAARGQLAAGEAALMSGGGRYGAEWVALASAALSELVGDPRSAMSTLAMFWDIGESLKLTFHRRLLAPVLAGLASRSGDSARVQAVAEQMTELADANDVQGLRATARLCAALAGSDERLARDAVELARTDGRPLERALVFETAAGLLAPGDPASAAATLSAAADLYASLGAAASTRRCESALRRLGVRVPRRRGPDRPAEGWGSLTSTELRVADLVAEGLSNAEVAAELHISRYTVETHVKHIYAKLAVRSRVRLARVVHEHRSR